MVSLTKNPPKTMVEMLLKAQNYMNAQNALAAIRDVEKTGDKGKRRTIGKDKKGSIQIVEPVTGVKGKTKKLLEW